MPADQPRRGPRAVGGGDRGADTGATEPGGPRIRLAHVIWRLSLGGGVPVVARAVLRGLDQREFDVHVVTARPSVAEDRLEEIESATLHTYDWAGGRNLRGILGFSAWAARELDKIDPDVVHTHGGTGYRLIPSMPVVRVPRVLEVHDALGGGKHSRLVDRTEALLVRSGMFEPVVHSTDVQRKTAHYLGRDPATVRIIPLGVPQWASPTDVDYARTRLGLPLGRVIVFYSGRARTKNVKDFIETAALLSEGSIACHFVLVGQAPESLDSMVRRLVSSGHLTLLSWVDRVDEVLLAADVFYSPSLDEGFGLAIVEAMMAGKPVVAAAVGGVQDTVIHGETGLLFPPGDFEEGVRSLSELLADGNMRRRMGDAGRTRASILFTQESMVAAYASLYRELAESRSRRDRSM